MWFPTLILHSSKALLSTGQRTTRGTMIELSKAAVELGAKFEYELNDIGLP